MESKFRKTVELKLTLNEQEAVWLHNTMQNPLHNQMPHEEAEIDARMRQKFFKATQPIQEETS